MQLVLWVPLQAAGDVAGLTVSESVHEEPVVALAPVVVQESVHFAGETSGPRSGETSCTHVITALAVSSIIYLRAV